MSFDAATGRVDLPAARRSRRPVQPPSTSRTRTSSASWRPRPRTDRSPGARRRRRDNRRSGPHLAGAAGAAAGYGADIVVGTTQPLGVHLNAGGGAGGFIATRDEERYARQYPTLQVSLAGTLGAGRTQLRDDPVPPVVLRLAGRGNDWTGNSVYLWAVVNAVYMALLGRPASPRSGTRSRPTAHYAARATGQRPGCLGAAGAGSSRNSWWTSTPRDEPSPRSTRPARPGDLRRARPQRGLSRTRPGCALLRHGDPQRRRHRRADLRSEGADSMTRTIRKYHAPVWDEPLIMEMGAPGRRGAVPPAPIDPSVSADDPGRAAPRSAAGAAGAVRARGAAPLSAPVPGDDGHGGHQSLRHLHDEVQPPRERAARRPPDSRRCAPAPARRDGARAAGDHPPDGPLAAGALRAWTASFSSPGAVPRRLTRTPSSPAHTMRPAASWDSATR